MILAALLVPGIASAQQLPEGKGKDVTQRVCSSCHAVDVFAKQRRTKSEWSDNVEKMIGRGATLSDQEFDVVVEYLTAYLGPVKVNVNKAQAKEIETVLGVAPKEAEALVKYRQERGEFKNWEEFVKAALIDPAKLEALKDRVEFR